VLKVDERDMYDVLFLLHEARGSIDTLTNLEDGGLCSVLMEDNKRINDAIKILFDMIRQNRQNEIMELIHSASRKSLEETKSE